MEASKAATPVGEVAYEVVIKGVISGIPPELLKQYFQQSITFSMNMAGTVRHVDINIDSTPNIIKPQHPLL